MTDHTLHIGNWSAEALADVFGTPLYVYDAEKIRARFREMRSALVYPDTDLHYACKANTNLAILRLLRKEGALIDAVSPGEVFLAMRAGYPPDRIIYTGNNVTDDEMRFLIERTILINIDSLSQLERYGRMGPGGRVSLRINPDVGSGHHDHCITGGPDSKFGIPLEHIDRALTIAERFHLDVIGLHAHVGSGILDPAPFLLASDALIHVAARFDRLEFVDFGGGFGVPYNADDGPLDIAALGRQLSGTFEAFCRSYGRPLRLKLEPGRFIVGESGALLTRCNTIKATPQRVFAGVDSGLHHLIRYPLYNAYHEIVNASNMNDEPFVYDVCGQICESSDFFARARRIARIREGDLLAVLNAGAYGFAMSSNYNTRPRPAEALIDGQQARLIRRRETIESLLNGQADL